MTFVYIRWKENSEMPTTHSRDLACKRQIMRTSIIQAAEQYIFGLIWTNMFIHFNQITVAQLVCGLPGAALEFGAPESHKNFVHILTNLCTIMILQYFHILWQSMQTFNCAFYKQFKSFDISVVTQQCQFVYNIHDCWRATCILQDNERRSIEDTQGFSIRVSRVRT